MKSLTLSVLASSVGLCAAENGVNNGVLISALVFSVLGFLVAAATLIFVLYRGTRRAEYKKAPQEDAEFKRLEGGYRYSNPHSHSLKDGSYYTDQRNWYYNHRNDEYEWGYILVAGFCCLVTTIVIGLVVWAVIVHL
jgi:hypothetical protein